LKNIYCTHKYFVFKVYALVARGKVLIKMDDDVKTLQPETTQSKLLNSSSTPEPSIGLEPVAKNHDNASNSESATNNHVNGTEVIDAIKSCSKPPDSSNTNEQNTTNVINNHLESSALNGSNASVIGNGLDSDNNIDNEHAVTDVKREDGVMGVEREKSSSGNAGVAYYMYYPESVRETQSSSPPHATPVAPTLAAVAASNTHTCGSLYAQCGVNHHQHDPISRPVNSAHSEPVSLSEILTEPSYYTYNEHFNVISTLDEEEEEDNQEALLREYHKQQLRFLASMGNGVSAGSCTSTSSNNQDYEYLRGLVPQLKREAKEWETKSDSLEAEVIELRRELKIREQEVLRLQREVHKLKRILKIKPVLSVHPVSIPKQILVVDPIPFAGHAWFHTLENKCINTSDNKETTISQSARATPAHPAPTTNTTSSTSTALILIEGETSDELLIY
ncbi:hypothetical protein L9F63_010133, partial [Diploptera punctata]